MATTAAVRDAGEGHSIGTGHVVDQSHNMATGTAPWPPPGAGGSCGGNFFFYFKKYIFHLKHRFYYMDGLQIFRVF